MTCRQRLGIVLMTSALFGGICLPAIAGELTPAQTGNAATTPVAQPVPAVQARPAQSAPAQAAQPAAPAPKAARATPTPRRIAHAVPRTRIVAPAAPVQREVQIAAPEPAPSGGRVMAFATMFGIAY